MDPNESSTRKAVPVSPPQGLSSGPDAFSMQAGFKASVPVLLGYVSIGLACGVVERTAGMSILEIFLMSLLLYAGSAQFITAGMLGAGAAPAAIIPTVAIVNLRHLLLSAALAPSLRRLPLWQSLTVGAELTDETFAVASAAWAGRETGSARWFWGLNVAAQATWILATVLGGLLGSLVGDIGRLGLDFALPAMFAGLLILGLQGRPRPGLGAAVAAGAGVLAVGLTLWLGGTAPIILATILAAGVGAFFEWRAERRMASASRSKAERRADPC
jgi:4-azaleucine resistance transporter AzlC